MTEATNYREKSIRQYHTKHREKWGDRASDYCADCYLLTLVDSARTASAPVDVRCAYPGCASLIPDGEMGARDDFYVHKCTDEETHARMGDTIKCHPFQSPGAQPERGGRS